MCIACCYQMSILTFIQIRWFYIGIYFVVVQSLSRVRLSVTPWIAACQDSLSSIISWNLLKLMSIELVMPSNHLILCHAVLLLPSIFPSIRVFPNESVPGISSVHFSSVNQSCPTLCDPMNCSTPGLPVHHQLPEFTQTHVHRVSDAIQPFHPRLSPSSPAPNPSQHQSLFQ